MSLLAVGLGGAAGAVSRYVASEWLQAGGYVLGSLLLGLFAVALGAALATALHQARV